MKLVSMWKIFELQGNAIHKSVSWTQGEFTRSEFAPYIDIGKDRLQLFQARFSDPAGVSEKLTRQELAAYIKLFACRCAGVPSAAEASKLNSFKIT